jgi:hypothetical protein
MNVTFFLQESTFEEDGNLNRFIYSVQQANANLVTAKYTPFGEMNYDILNQYKNNPIVFYGSLNLTKDVQRRFPADFFPFAWCDLNLFKSSFYLQYLGKFSLQQEYALYPTKELPRLKNYLFKNNDKLFFRPDDNDKPFDGQVVAKENFDPWFELMSLYNPKDYSLALVSPYKIIEKEYRLVIYNRKVIASSMYKENNFLTTEPIADTHIIEFAENVCKEVTWQPHPIYVMDVGSTNHNYFIIEIGSINCAGLYKADIQPVVNAMIELAIKEWKIHRDFSLEPE